VAAQDGGILADVQERGTLICGVHGGLPGMSSLNAETNEFEGMDADFCRGVAAAVGVDNIEFVPVTGDARQGAIASEVDVLFRNTTNTLSRDAGWGSFGPTILYDGQGMMVRADSGVESLADLDGATICVTTGTTTLLNLADAMAVAGAAYEQVAAAETATVYGTYEEGTCDGVTSDRSQLIGLKATFADPDAHVILEDSFSKEPLGPVTRHGDDQWADIITWVVNATVTAEELGITAENVDSMAGGDNPSVQRFLGEEGALGEALGIENDFAVNVIKAIGNYGEVYDRHYGPDALNLPRGVNNLYTNGGILYSPPFR
jgi:general L-amino acid transport system substrate-binding protein